MWCSLTFGNPFPLSVVLLSLLLVQTVGLSHLQVTQQARSGKLNVSASDTSSNIAKTHQLRHPPDDQQHEAALREREQDLHSDNGVYGNASLIREVAFGFDARPGSLSLVAKNFIEDIRSRPASQTFRPSPQTLRLVGFVGTFLLLAFLIFVGRWQHVRLLCANPSQGHPTWNGKQNAEKGAVTLSRPYTPVSSTTSETLDLVVRKYPTDVDRGFPQGGRASCFLTDQLAVGDEIMASGHHGHKVYLGGGLFRVGTKHVRAQRCAAVVAGSGVTPVLALLRELRQEAKTAPGTKASHSVIGVSVVQVTRSSTEALPVSMFEVDENPVCELCNVTAKPKQSDTMPQHDACAWYQGSLTEEIVKSHVPTPADDVVVVLCGPRGFVVDLCQPMLQELGYTNVVVLW